MALLDDVLGIGGQFLGAGLQFGAAQERAQSIIDGAEISAAASGMTAAGYRQSARAVEQAAQFNQSIDALNLSRRLDSIARAQRLTTGKQLTAQATSGLSLGSKSFLMVQSEARSMFETSLLNVRIDAENQRRSNRFQTQVQQATLENKARAAEFQASSSRAIAQAQARQVTDSATADLVGTGVRALSGSLGTLLGGK